MAVADFFKILFSYLVLLLLAGPVIVVAEGRSVLPDAALWPGKTFRSSGRTEFAFGSPVLGRMRMFPTSRVGRFFLAAGPDFFHEYIERGENLRLNLRARQKAHLRQLWERERRIYT